MRNPFKKQDENVRPSNNLKVPSTSGSKPVQINDKTEDPTEYKLSEINDSGVFVPPSPPEKASVWGSLSRSTTSSNHRSLINENEQFNISRESFDSYRRSFDISARSPIIQPEQRSRMSLDSRPPRVSNTFARANSSQLGTAKEEDPSDALEDVSLDDQKPLAPPKKKNMFSRFMDSSSSDQNSERPTSQEGQTKSGLLHFGGRKRGQSGQGSELGSMPKKDEKAKGSSRLGMGKDDKTAAPAAPLSPATPTSLAAESRTKTDAPTTSENTKSASKSVTADAKAADVEANGDATSATVQPTGSEDDPKASENSAPKGRESIDTVKAAGA